MESVKPRPLTEQEEEVLRGLDGHAELHARVLLAARPELRVTSGRRSPERNRAVGGVPGSYHVKGRAVDFDAPDGYLARSADYARAQRVSPGCTGPEEVLVHDAGSGMHLHVAW